MTTRRFANAFASERMHSITRKKMSSKPIPFLWMARQRPTANSLTFRALSSGSSDSSTFAPYEPEANGKTVYIEGRGEIVALDTATGTTTGIAFGDEPGALAVSPDGAELYATDSLNSTIYVISTATNKLVSSFEVPTSPNSAIFGPRAMAFSPDGTKLYVTDAGAVSVVDTANDSVSSTIAFSGTAWAIAVSPNGELVYALLWESGNAAGTVAMIDTATGAVSKVTVGSAPYGLSFTPDGSKAYVADCQGNSVSIIDTATGTVTGTVAAAPIRARWNSPRTAPRPTCRTSTAARSP